MDTKRLKVIVGKKREKIRNEKLLRQAEMQSAENYVRKYHLRWAEHVRRMENDQMPKKVMETSKRKPSNRKAKERLV